MGVLCWNVESLSTEGEEVIILLFELSIASACTDYNNLKYSFLMDFQWPFIFIIILQDND